MDYIINSISNDGFVRITGVYAKNLVNKATQIHKTSPVVSAALGRLLMGGLLMANDFKNEENYLNLIVKGDGPLQGICVTAYKNKVKGYPYQTIVNTPLNYLNKLDVGGAIGYGELTVIKRIVSAKEPYISRVPLTTGEIGDDLTYYYAISEQIPTSIGVGVLVDVDYTIKTAGGFMLQLLPGASEEVIEKIEKNLSQLGDITTNLDNNQTIEDIIFKLYDDMKILNKENISFECDCSTEKMARSLQTLPKDELESILKEQGTIEVNCHFCNNKFQYSDLNAIYN